MTYKINVIQTKISEWIFRQNYSHYLQRLQKDMSIEFKVGS